MPSSGALPSVAVILLLLLSSPPGRGQVKERPLVITIPDSLTKSLAVESVPTGASVWINGTLAGTTPFSSPNIEYGMNVVMIHKSEYSIFLDTVIIRFGSHATINARLSKPGALQVKSTPPGAKVYLDDELLGETPLEKGELRAGERRLSLIAKKHEPWASVVVVPEDSVVQITAELVREHGTLDVSVAPSDGLIVIEGDTLAEGSLVGHKLPQGQYLVRLIRPSSGVTAEQMVYVPLEGTVRIEAKLNEKTLKPVLWSALVPGLGQFVSGAKTEGAILLSGTAVLGGWATYNVISYSSALSTYEDARQQYLDESTSEDLLLQYRNDMKLAYDTAQKKYTVRNISIAVFGAFYLYTLVDAYLFHTETVVLTVRNEDDLGIQGKLPIRGRDGPQLTVTVPF